MNAEQDETLIRFAHRLRDAGISLTDGQLRGALGEFVDLRRQVTVLRRAARGDGREPDQPTPVENLADGGEG